MNYNYWFQYFLKRGLIAFSFFILDAFLIDIGEKNPMPAYLESIDSQDEIIVGQAIYNDLISMKLAATKKINPEIITIGSSRVNNFRAGMFEPYSFYNLSRTTDNLSLIKFILESLDSLTNLKVVIVNLQTSSFREIEGQVPLDVNKFTDSNKPKRLYPKKIIRLKRGLFNSNFQFHRNLGITGQAKGRGLRSLDGSVHGGKFHIHTKEQQNKRFDSYKKRRKNISSTNFFVNLNSDINSKSIEAYINLVDYAKNRGITIIGITPPYSEQVNTMLDSDLEKFKLFHTFKKQSTIEMMKSISGFYYNFTDHEEIGSSPLEMLDLIHPSEKVCAKMLIKMMEDDNFSKLLPEIDTAQIRKQIESTDLPLLDIYSKH